LRVFAFSLVVLTGTMACDRSFVSRKTQEHSPVDFLLQAEAVDDSAVGEVTRTEMAVRTARYEAFSQLYLGGNASRSDAKRLVDSSSPAGRIYGYLILRHVSPKDAAVATQRLLQDHSQVDVRNGCIVSTSTVGELVAHIQRGYYVIHLPK
jgi:hypothetical protein